MRSLWLVTLVLVARIGAARAAPVVEPGLPFTAEQLEHALAPRVDVASIAGLVVTADGAGVARVHAAPAGMTRIVSFGDRTGYAAARVVALAIYDLLLVEPAQPVLARLDEVARADRVVIDRHAPDRAATGRPAIQLAALGGVMTGTRPAERAGLSLSVALTAALGDRLRGRISVGTWWISEAPPSSTSAVLQALPVRLGVGIRRGAVHVIAAPIVMPYALSGTVYRRSALVGLGASADASVPIGGGIRLVAACGVDAFVNQIEVRNNGARVFATPRVAVSGALGIAVEVGR